MTPATEQPDRSPAAPFPGRRPFLFPHVWKAAILLLAAFAPITVTADQQDAIESGREELTDAAPGWYDPETDSLRRIRVKKQEEPQQVDRSDSETEPQQRRQRNAPPAASEAAGSAVQGIGWLLIAIVLLLIVGGLIYAFLRREDSESDERPDSGQASSAAVDRIEELPVNVRPQRGTLLDEARRLYQQGEFNQAVVYLYSYLLVELDKRQVIHLTRGKTNRQYLREARRQPRLAATLETTMFAFEDAFFGGHPLPRERFEQCWSRLDHFHADLQQST